MTEIVHVCEKGHADDEHKGENLCSRCGGKTIRLSLDALAKFAIERNLLFKEVDCEIAYLEELAQRHKARVHMETVNRLQGRRDHARLP
jgi:hypothetical protein